MPPVTITYTIKMINGYTPYVAGSGTAGETAGSGTTGELRRWAVRQLRVLRQQPKLRVLEQRAKLRVLEQWANCVDGRVRQLRVLEQQEKVRILEQWANCVDGPGGYVNCGF